LKTARSTVRSAQVRLKIETISAQILTPTGLRTVAMVTAKDLYKLAEDLQPDLAEMMLMAGANLYIYGLAGYKISVSETTPAPQQPLTAFEYASLYVEAEKGRLALAAQIEKDKSATELGKLIDKAEGNISMGEYAKAIGTGRQRLFDQLREQKIIMPLPLNTPYQHHLEAKRFVVTEKVTEQGHVFAVTLITPKGQTYLAKKHLEYQNREKIVVMVEKELELV
jgi:phage antirepressor YoqD-like protein